MRDYFAGFGEFWGSATADKKPARKYSQVKLGFDRPAARKKAKRQKAARRVNR